MAGVILGKEDEASVLRTAAKASLLGTRARFNLQDRIDGNRNAARRQMQLHRQVETPGRTRLSCDERI
jgi:hypothetical protein